MGMVTLRRGGRSQRVKIVGLIVFVLVVLVTLGGCTAIQNWLNPNHAPVAVISANPTSGEAPLEVAFDASQSYDPDGDQLTYQWAFGDGKTGVGKMVHHTFSAPGNYTARLTVTDDRGATGVESLAITIFLQSATNLVSNQGGKVETESGATATFSSGVLESDTPVTIAETEAPDELPIEDSTPVGNTVVIEIPAHAIVASTSLATPASPSKAITNGNVTVEVPIEGDELDPFAVIQVAVYVSGGQISTSPAGISSKGISSRVKRCYLGFARAVKSGAHKVKVDVTSALQEVRGLPGTLAKAEKIKLQVALVSLKKTFTGWEQEIGDWLSDQKFFDSIARQIGRTIGKDALPSISMLLEVQTSSEGVKVGTNFHTDYLPDPKKGQMALVLIPGFQLFGEGVSTKHLTDLANGTAKYLVSDLARDFPKVAKRYRIYAFVYDPSRKIKENGEDLRKWLKFFAYNRTKVVIVAHSMGGLVARSAIEEGEGADNVKKLITLGTPHRGVPVANVQSELPKIPIFGLLSKIPIFALNTDGSRDCQVEGANPWLKSLNAKIPDNLYKVYAGSVNCALPARLSFDPYVTLNSALFKDAPGSIERVNLCDRCHHHISHTRLKEDPCVTRLVCKDLEALAETPRNQLNQPPVAKVSPDRTETVVCTQVLLDGRKSSDPDGDPLSYHWSQVAGPPTILASPLDQEGNPIQGERVLTPCVAGTYTIRLVVNDGKVDSEPVDVTITIDEKSAPSIGSFVYDRQKAINYAENNWDKHNPSYGNYSDEGGDCANFVSQCLIAGKLNLSGYPGANGKGGTITSCASLQDYLVNYLGARCETRNTQEREPTWFKPGDIVILPTPKHAAFAVGYDKNHLVYDDHFLKAGNHRITIGWYSNRGWNYCTYYHIPEQPSPNKPPTVTITAPADGSTFNVGDTITLQGSATDPEDGPLTGSSLVWTLSLGDVIGIGESVVCAPTEGTWTFILTATDSQGAKGTASVTITVKGTPSPNQPPTVIIISPADGSTFNPGDMITFQGSATDPEDGPLSGASLVWISNIDGQIGTGKSFTRSDLSVGTHTFTLTATDSQGAKGTASVTITVKGTPSPNQPPTVTIISPADGSTFNPGDMITFQGSATDPEDGLLTGSPLVWTSSIDGQIGTGESFTKSDLSIGTHTITLTAIDSQGAKGTASVTLTVKETTPPGPAEGKIAFASDRDGNWEIYVMNPDGSDQRRLTNNTYCGHPAWSPDGTKIVFHWFCSGFRDKIYVMNADGSGQHNANGAEPSWSPDGTKIAFLLVLDHEIYVMNADGSDQRRLTSNTYSGHPAWSPDGTKIAFASARDGIWEIYVMNPDGSDQHDITNDLNWNDFDPVWSPDGTKIAFISDRDGNWEIYVMNADGSDQRRLTNDLSWEDQRFAWSPDGTKIAFATEEQDGNEEIYVMNADGSNQHNITNSPHWDYEPAWSPDGTKIAFRSDRDGNWEIYVMNADGSNQHNITNDPANDGEPAWSPVLP